MRKEFRTNPAIECGDGETVSSYMGRLDEYLSKLEWQSEGHRMWYTHKNPYGCWICEILQISRRLRELVPMDDGDDSEGLDEEYPDVEEEPK